MIGEHDVGFERLVEHRLAIRGRVVVGQRAARAGLAVILGESADTIDIKHARLGFRQRMRVDVGRVDQASRKKSFLAQQDRQGIRLLARAAAGHPDLQRRVGPQQRHDLLAQRPEIRRVAKHLAHLHGEEIQ